MNKRLMKYKKQHIEFLKNNRKLSDSALTQHNHSLNIFYKFLVSNKIKTFEEINSNLINKEFKKYLKNSNYSKGREIKNISQNTINGILYNLKSFLSYLKEEGLSVINSNAVTVNQTYLSDFEYLTKTEVMSIRKTIPINNIY